MNDRDFGKLASPLMRRVQNMLARGVVQLSNAAAKMQTQQLTLLAAETSGALEHFEPYGFTSRPQPGAEAVAAFIDGDRSHGLVIVVADRRYRMTGFAAGEVALHDDQGQSVHLTRGGIVIKGAGRPIVIQDTPKLTITADDVVINGKVAIAGGGLTHNGVNVGATHRHSQVKSGSDTSGVPQ